MTTFAPLPASDWPQTELALTSSVAVSPARTSALQEPGPVWRASAPVYGVITPALFANFDPASLSWKTSQRSLVEDLETFSETWPRSGITHGGTASRLPPLAPLTVATGSGLLPTPEASNTKATALRSGGRSPRNFLGPLWPTPHASCGTGAGSGPNKTGGLNLQTAVQMWPTPSSSMSKGSSPASLTRKDGRDRTTDRLDHAVMALDGGQLNPEWVEWLMGFPPGWTACMTDGQKSRRSRASPAGSPPEPLACMASATRLSRKSPKS